MCTELAEMLSLGYHIDIESVETCQTYIDIDCLTTANPDVKLVIVIGVRSEVAKAIGLSDKLNLKWTHYKPHQWLVCISFGCCEAVTEVSLKSQVHFNRRFTLANDDTFHDLDMFIQNKIAPVKACPNFAGLKEKLMACGHPGIMRTDSFFTTVSLNDTEDMDNMINDFKQ